MMVRRMCVPVVWMIASHLQCAMRSSQSVECRVPRSIACLVTSAIVLLRWCCSVLLVKGIAQTSLPQHQLENQRRLQLS